MSQRLRSITIIGMIALLAVFALVPIAWAGPSAAEADSLEAEDQPIVNGTITVKKVNASQDGWIVVRLDSGGNPGDVIGHTAVKKGETSAVVIKLSQDVPVGGKLWPILHIDAGKPGTYEFPGPDAPVFVNNMMVRQQITVTTAAPRNLPRGGGADAPTGLLLIALALLAGGLLTLRIRRRHI